MAGFWPDIEKSRAEARRLLKEAGAEGLTFELLNRNVDQPYKYRRHLDRRRVEQDRRDTSRRRWCRPARGSRRCASGNFDVVVEANCNSVVNPLLDTQKYLPHAVFTENYGGYERSGRRSISTTRCCSETDFAKQRGADARSTRPTSSIPGARVADAVVVPDDPGAVLREGLEDRSQPLHQPGPGEHLARPVAAWLPRRRMRDGCRGADRRTRGQRCTATSRSGCCWRSRR